MGLKLIYIVYVGTAMYHAKISCDERTVKTVHNLGYHKLYMLLSYGHISQVISAFLFIF